MMLFLSTGLMPRLVSNRSQAKGCMGVSSVALDIGKSLVIDAPWLVTEAPKATTPGLGGIFQISCIFLLRPIRIHHLLLIEFCYSLLGGSRAHPLWMRRFWATAGKKNPKSKIRPQKPPDLTPITIAISLIVEVFLLSSW
jgi:hypothetical protein